MPYKKPPIWEVRLRSGALLDVAGNAKADARERPTRMSCPAGCGASKEHLGKGIDPPQAYIARARRQNHHPFE